MDSSTKALIPGLISAVLTSLVGTGLLSTFLFNIDQSKSEMIMTIDNKHNKGILEIKNVGENTLTNFSLFFESPQIVEKIVNNFSTTDIFIPNKNISLQNGQSSYINNSFIEIQIPKIIKDSGSIILIDFYINDIKDLDTSKIRINGIYDQGSTKGSIYSENNFGVIITSLELLGVGFFIFVIIFMLFAIITLRNKLKERYELYLLGLREMLKNNNLQSLKTNHSKYINSLLDIHRSLPRQKWLVHHAGLEVKEYFERVHRNPLFRWAKTFNPDYETLEHFLFKNNTKILVFIQDLLFNITKLKTVDNSSNEGKKLIDESLTLIENILGEMKIGKRILSKQKQTD